MMVVTQLDAVRKELGIICKLNHKNIIKADEIIEDTEDSDDGSDKIYIVMELALYKEVMSWNENSYQFVPNKIFGSQFISSEVILTILKDLANGLDYLHNEKGIVHRDIKP